MQIPGRLFSHTAGCPIQPASFSSWVGNHELRPQITDDCHPATYNGGIPNSRLFIEKVLHQIVKATLTPTTFDQVAIYFDTAKVSSAFLLTFYARRDRERCQSSRARTTIPGSSIGDISPCVEPLFLLSSQSFTNERRTYQLARTRSASIWHGMPTALVRNKPSQN
jgi:hypothetical protein